MDDVLAYIHDNWKNTIQEPQNGVPFSFCSPSMNEVNKDFYYWDTYFINIGLMIVNNLEQVENNLDNIKHFIDNLGYMPNSNTQLNRSQPPFFTRAVYEYWKFTKNNSVISKYIDSILKEHNFWQQKRNTPFAINSYQCHDSYENIMKHYKLYSCRVGETSDDLRRKEEIGQNIIAIAESGLDFNMRFKTEKSKIASSEFLHLDLNCILYDAEIKLAEMLRVIGNKKTANFYEEKAQKRKNLIDKYFLTQSGIYFDYNFVTKKHSRILAATSLYPYVFGISKDPIGAKKVLRELELEHGLTIASYRGKDTYFQWDYPTVCGAMTLLSYWALKNVGLNEDAERIKNKFILTVKNVFLKKHKLYEKYNGLTGTISNAEYEAPEMMGWTAAAYSYFLEGLKI